jgi:prevent-host-death family protein
MLKLHAVQTVGSYETKTHLADILRRVRAGQHFVITQKGEAIAELSPTAQSVKTAASRAATAMLTWSDAHHIAVAEGDLRTFLASGRD